MLGLRRGSVCLVEHDERWAAEAELAIGKLKSILGEIAIAAEHVGSTSIQGIKAKPIIDVAVGVKDLDDVLYLEDALKAEGFIHAPENDNDWQVYFYCGSSEDEVITHHIHVVRYGGREWNGYLTFRDRLTRHRDEALAYEALKQELMEKFEGDRKSYTEAKAEFILNIISKGKGD